MSVFRLLPGEVEVVVVGVVVPDVVVVAEPCFGFGLGFGVVEVEVEVEVEVDVVGVGVVAVTVAAGVVAVTGGQDWETFVIAAPAGIGSAVGGVPGAMFWNTSVSGPVGRLTVTVTVQPSADAFGRAASPRTATIQPKVTAAIFSFRLVNTVAYSSRGLPLANSSSQLPSQVGLTRTLLAAGSFAIRNRRCGACQFG